MIIMISKIENIITPNKFKGLWRFLYWLFAAMLLFFVFSNSRFDFVVRIGVVLVLTIMSFGLSQLINSFLVPNYLFKGRYFLFFYLLFGSVLVSIWVNMLCIMVILWYTVTHFEGTLLPNSTDLTLLISGSYIIILFAAFVHFIKETFYRQMERDRIARQKAETDLKLQEARLKLLQGQLHPHFLFNMLNNLYGLWMEKSDTTPEVILKLSSLLDYMLYQCNIDKIPLKKEIGFIQNYIELESIRHDQRLKVEMNLENYDENFQIAPLILFVFVENAFKHGANRNSGESHISLNLSSKERHLNFSISNNYSINAKSNEGLGLNNVIERLEMIYKDKHKLIIDDKNGTYKVSLDIEID